VSAPAAEGRIGQSLATIEQAVQECSLPELPELVSQVAATAARVACLTTLRLAGSTADKTPAQPERLLTAAEVADVLRISESELYRRAKTDLKSASVVLGPGSLRFDPERVRRFIRSRAG
jgi:predicted DNA-binding transcriptional regulator AlpA